MLQGILLVMSLDTDQVYTINLSSSALDAVNITTDTITSFQYNISDSSDDAEASFLFRNGATTRFIHTGGRLRFECDELQTSGTANFSSLNASNISGYQQTLIAGTNITITGNTISSAGGTLPANVNFSSVNTSTLNTSTIDSSGRVDIGAANGQSKGLVITGMEPTITFKDTNARSGMIHMNSNNMFFYRGYPIAKFGRKSMGSGLLFYTQIQTEHNLAGI